MKCTIIRTKDLFGPINTFGKLSANFGMLIALLNSEKELTFHEKLEALSRMQQEHEPHKQVRNRRQNLKLLAQALPVPLDTVNYLTKLGKLGPLDTKQQSNMQHIAELLEEYKVRDLKRKAAEHLKLAGKIQEQRNKHTVYPVPSIYFSTRPQSTDEKICFDIAAKAHRDVMDSTGRSYILHPQRVGDRGMEMVYAHSDFIKALGLNIAQTASDVRKVGNCHDVLEDRKDYSKERLVQLGFPSRLIPALESVTHKDGESYAASICRAKEDIIGRFVKMADLTDNSTLARFPINTLGKPLPKFLDPLEKALNRHQKYYLSYLFLADWIDEKDYIHRLLPLG